MNIKNYEEFNLEEYFQQVKEQLDKPNVLLCGSAESGKSSIIDTMFITNDTELTPSEINNHSKSGNVTLYSAWYAAVNLYDIEGCKSENRKKAYCKMLIRFIDRQQKQNPGQIEKHIHEIWYCIPVESKALPKTEEAILKALARKNIPVTILLIKTKLTDELLLDALTKDIHQKIPFAKCYPFSTEIDGEEPSYEAYCQAAQLVERSVGHLDEFLRQDIIPVIGGELQERRREIIRSYIPKYSGIAAASVVGSALIPVPLSDSVLLVAIQVRMAQSIIHAYGIEADIGKVIIDIVGMEIISYIGKTFAFQIASVIPFVGKVATGTVNISVAATLTAVVGSAVAVIAEQYLTMCVKKGGAENISFTDFITSERFIAAVQYVKENKKEFNLEPIVGAIKKKYAGSGNKYNKIHDKIEKAEESSAEK